ncbi:MAG: Flp family type IVb pilin [Pseudomonadota bacterium]
MTKQFVTFVNNESGASSMEYGLVAAGIAVAIISSVNMVGCSLNTVFYQVANGIRSAG